MNFEKHIVKTKQHDKLHILHTILPKSSIIDESCALCYYTPSITETNPQFFNFWNWYYPFLEASSFTVNTVNLFQEFLEEIERNNTATAWEKLDSLLFSIRYRSSPGDVNSVKKLVLGIAVKT